MAHALPCTFITLCLSCPPHVHFKVTPLMPVKRSSFVLHVGDEEAAIDFARGAAPCKEGILTVLKAAHAPEWRGYLELKLHGDAGDLELWLYGGFALSNSLTALYGGKPLPFDVPKETVIRLTFPSHPGKAVEMRVRNADKNEDEQGTPNMRGGTHTNFFSSSPGRAAPTRSGSSARSRATSRRWPSRPTARHTRATRLCSCPTRRSETDK